MQAQGSLKSGKTFLGKSAKNAAGTKSIDVRRRAGTEREK